MKETKMSLGRRLALVGYGLGVVRKETPGYIPLSVGRAVCIAAQPLVVLYFSARILDGLSGGRDVPAIALYTAITVGVTFLLTALRAVLTRRIELESGYERMYIKINHRMAARFAQIDFAHAESSKLAEELALMDVRARGNGLGLVGLYGHINLILEPLFSAVFSLALLFGPLSAGSMGTGGYVAYGIFALGLLAVVRMNGIRKDMLARVYKDNARANASIPYYKDYIGVDGAAKEVRLYDQSGYIDGLLRKSFSLKVWVRFFFLAGALEGFGAALLAAVGGAFYLTAGLAALDGGVSVGSVVQMVGATTVFAAAIGNTVSRGARLVSEAEFVEPYRDFDRLPDLLQKGSRPIPPDTAHELELRDVYFRYPGAAGYALEGVSLKLHAGQRLAVVGLNGSGKTTMIKLLCRLYDPERGQILLDGVDIKEYDYAEYMNLFSVVFQDFMLMPLALGENVSAGSAYDRQKAEKCLDLAGFSSGLEKMPQKLDTMLYRSFDENGTRVSGGEAQKIALARALYRNAPIVILDEPTAALDPIAEFEVYSTFERTIGGKTAVFISHRLSSCRFCHDIAVFEGGKIIERGSHDELLQKGGRYSELWQAQAKHYVEQEQIGC